MTNDFMKFSNTDWVTNLDVNVTFDLLDTNIINERFKDIRMHHAAMENQLQT